VRTSRSVGVNVCRMDSPLNIVGRRYSLVATGASGDQCALGERKSDHDGQDRDDDASASSGLVMVPAGAGAGVKRESRTTVVQPTEWGTASLPGSTRLGQEGSCQLPTKLTNATRADDRLASRQRGPA